MKALLLVSGAAAVAASGLGAQVAPAKPDSACTTYPGGRVECRVYRGPGDSSRLHRILFSMDSTLAKRAALGMEIRSTGTRRDTLGVFVEAVTPKGPAEAAGIIEGDRIVSINGVDLRTTAADTEDSYTNGLAAHRLTREVQKLTPGTRVSLRVWSGGRIRDVQVTAGRASDVRRLGARMMPGMGGMMRFGGPAGGAMMFGPDMQMLRERLEPMRDMEPMLRERLKDLPNRIELRTPLRFKTLAPTRVRSPLIYKVDRAQLESGPAEIDWIDGDNLFDDGEQLEFDEPFILDLDAAPFDFSGEIEEVSPGAIRDLAATAIRDARVALAQLAAAGIA